MKYSLIFLFLFTHLQAEYEAINAFPNLSFIDPVGIYHAGDNSNRIFVIEQEGRIKVFNNDLNTTNTESYFA